MIVADNLVKAAGKTFKGDEGGYICRSGGSLEKRLMTTNPMAQAIGYLRGVLLEDASEVTDGSLLESFVLRKDAAALTALVRRHSPMVWGVCRRLLRSHHDAEDALQATFLVLVQKASSIQPKEMVANWLYGVARLTALRARAVSIRRGTRERQVAQVSEQAVAQQEHWDEGRSVLDQELSRLPDKYRVLIVLCDLEGKSRKEVARQFGCPEGTVAGRLARARAMLAKRLLRRGVAVSSLGGAAVLSPSATAACVPASLVSSTIKVVCAAGQSAAGGAPAAEVAVLTGWVLKSMLLGKIKATATVLLVVVGGILGVGGLASRMGAAKMSHLPGKAMREECKAQEGQEQARGGPENRPTPLPRARALPPVASAAPPPSLAESPPALPSRSDVPDWPDADTPPVLPGWPAELAPPRIVLDFSAIPDFRLVLSFHPIEQRATRIDAKDIKFMIIVDNN